MSIPLPTRQETARDCPFFAPRLRTLGLVGWAILALFGLRLAYLNVIRGADYYELSKENVSRAESIPAPRGIIYDRHNRALAANFRTYSIVLNPASLTSETLSHSLKQFEKISGIAVPDSKTHKSLAPLKKPGGKFPLTSRVFTIAPQVPFETAAVVAERAEEMPGIATEESVVRALKEPRALSHLIGFTGSIDKTRPDERKRYEEANIAIEPSDRIGKMNIERRYEDELRGRKGLQYQVYNSHNRPVDDPKIVDSAQQGADLILTVDLDLQTTASRLFDIEGYSGALIAINPQNGEILALISKPEFSYPKASAADSEFDKAIVGRYAPGSTFKIVTASAALSNGWNPEDVVVCERRWKYDMNCMFRHGPLNMIDALRSSCNIYFYTVADKVRWGALAETADAYGFGRRCEIDLEPTDAPGKIGVPSNDEQANSADGNVVQMAIGQGQNVSVTPLQLLCAYAAVANNEGRLPKPHLRKQTIYYDGRPPEIYSPGLRPLTPASDPKVRGPLLEGFRRVVEDPLHGTAGRAGFDPAWKVAGKTGSAQHAGQASTDAFFVGFAPWDNPEVAVIVLCENAGHGGEEAAPLAVKFLRSYFEAARRGEAGPTALPQPAAPLWSPGEGQTGPMQGWNLEVPVEE